MKAELTLIPTCIVNPSNIVVFNQVIWEPSRPSRKSETSSSYDEATRNARIIDSDRKSHGMVSKHAKRKMTKAIDYLVNTTHTRKQYEPRLNKTIVFKATFLTLTLPSSQVHDDKTIINKCLDPFLREIIKYHVVKKYVWRAEKQKNGNIHFHILTDSFIPYYEIRDRWNRIVNRLGYVNRYQEKNGRKQPNSTDIHSLRKIKNLKSYMIKYMTKDEKCKTNNDGIKAQEKHEGNLPHDDTAQQTGRIWGCSHNLSKIQGYRTEIDNETAEQIEKLLKSDKAKTYSGDYFTVINIRFQDLAAAGAEHLFYYFADYLLQTFDFNLQMET